MVCAIAPARLHKKPVVNAVSERHPFTFTMQRKLRFDLQENDAIFRRKSKLTTILERTFKVRIDVDFFLAWQL